MSKFDEAPDLPLPAAVAQYRAYWRWHDLDLDHHINGLVADLPPIRFSTGIPRGRS